MPLPDRMLQVPPDVHVVVLHRPNAQHHLERQLVELGHPNHVSRQLVRFSAVQRRRHRFHPPPNTRVRARLETQKTPQQRLQLPFGQLLHPALHRLAIGRHKQLRLLPGRREPGFGPPLPSKLRNALARRQFRRPVHRVNPVVRHRQRYRVSIPDMQQHLFARSRQRQPVVLEHQIGKQLIAKRTHPEREHLPRHPNRNPPRADLRRRRAQPKLRHRVHLPAQVQRCPHHAGRVEQDPGKPQDSHSPSRCSTTSRRWGARRCSKT